MPRIDTELSVEEIAETREWLKSVFNINKLIDFEMENITFAEQRIAKLEELKLMQEEFQEHCEANYKRILGNYKKREK